MSLLAGDVFVAVFICVMILHCRISTKNQQQALVYSINGNLDAISGLLENIRSECLIKFIRLIRKK